MANLSIYGLTLLYDGTGTIFDELVLPTQFTDPTVITDRLMLDTMELEVLYADPDVFKGALGIYSKSRIHSWQKLVDDMYKEYDPYINFTRDESRVNTVTRDLADVTNSAGSTQSKRNAWDGTTVGTMTPAEQSEDSAQSSFAQTGTLKTEDYFHSQGDSALFTPTDIARKEFELRAQLSAMEYILADIKTHFCLMVY